MMCVMGMIFYLSHQPYDFSRLPQSPGIDKLAHAIAYGGLAASFLYGLQPFLDTSGNNIVTVLTVMLFCIIYGISDEYHQSFIPGRFVSFWDVVADGFGALFVVGWWHKNSMEKGQRKYS